MFFARVFALGAATHTVVIVEATIMRPEGSSTTQEVVTQEFVGSTCGAAHSARRMTQNIEFQFYLRLSMLVLFLSCTLAKAACAADLIVNVDGVRLAKGKVLLELDDSAAGWDNKAKPLATGSVDAAVGTVTYTFKNLPPGTYAVGVIDDENDNGKLDTNFLGIPKEGFGFSNNVTAMRKPTFEEAHVDVSQQDATILIHLAHL